MAKKIDDLNSMFEKLIKAKDEKLKQAEDMKTRMLASLDAKIDELYKKRDFVAEIIIKRRELKKHKLSVWRKFRKAGFFRNIRFLISMPFIYMMIFPGLVFHLFLEIYHQICFRLYRIPLVRPKDYFVFDRRLLPYLNWFEKFNCFYCSYYNCLIAYAQEISGRTERYWCPIKHSVRMRNPHSHYDKFVDFDDAEGLRKRWKKLRKF